MVATTKGPNMNNTAAAPYYDLAQGYVAAARRSYDSAVAIARSVALAQGYAAAAPYYDLAQAAHDAIMAAEGTSGQ